MDVTINLVCWHWFSDDKSCIYILDINRGDIMGIVNKAILGSPWLVHCNCGSCNGCDIEVLACLTPVYDVERFGVLNIGNPKHADILVVSGAVNHRNVRMLKNMYEQMSEPKIVVAVGACACSGGIFRDCYNVLGGVDQIVPVDVYVPGCSARPEAIIQLLDQKRATIPSTKTVSYQWAISINAKYGPEYSVINPLTIS